MSEGNVGILILCAISIASGAICHLITRHYFVASAVAGVTSCILFLCLDRIRIGHLDPFFPIAFVVGSALAMAIALLTGVPFLLLRRRSRQSPTGNCQECGYNLTGNVSGVCPECGRRI